jgi:septal ring factor EnvC (AmiA/AmiB activator)
MTAGKALFLAACLSLSPSFLFAQKSKSQLQKERQQNLERIKETEKILEETAQEKKTTLGELTALNRRIEQQETLITSIKSEIELLDADIEEDNQIIDALSSDVGKLKEEYSAMLFAAQKTDNKINKLGFLFSSENFTQLVMRLKYMEQYDKARQDQAKAIERAQSLLNSQVKSTEAKRNDKKNLLSDEEKENLQMTSLKQKQRKVVRSLEKEEKRLRRDLDETKKALAEIDELIAKIVKEELERAAREARERERNKNKLKDVEAAFETTALSASFEENKNKFSWPVSGFVSQRFGRQMHPVLKGIQIQNDGVNIQTKQNEPVRAIFNGEVRKVAFIKGFGNTIILSHGDYFSVYCGLKEVFVKMGEKISTGHEIGRVVSNVDGISELRFQIRKNTEALDPQQWLRGAGGN